MSYLPRKLPAETIPWVYSTRKFSQPSYSAFRSRVTFPAVFGSLLAIAGLEKSRWWRH